MDDSEVPILRVFDASMDAVSEEWSNSAGARTWDFDDWMDKGSTGAFKVKSNDGIDGVAKPGIATPEVCCGPANEKIAADLAALLGLPIPPVVLYEWPIDRMNEVLKGKEKTPSQRFLAISAFAFSEDRNTSVLDANDGATLASSLTAIWAFDSWISARNRSISSGQAVISKDHGSTSGKNSIRIAYLDYALSLADSWRVGDEKSHDAAYWEFDESLIYEKRCIAIVNPMVSRIRRITAGQIDEIVTRIPDLWLPKENKDVVTKNLKSRQQRLKSLLDDYQHRI